MSAESKLIKSIPVGESIVLETTNAKTLPQRVYNTLGKGKYRVVKQGEGVYKIFHNAPRSSD